MPDVIDLANQYHDALARKDLGALKRIIEAYAGVQKRLEGSIDALLQELTEKGQLTRGQVERLARYKRLLRETEEEIEKFTNFMEVELGQIGRAAVNRGIKESLELIKAAIGEDAALLVQFRDLPPEAVERLLGFLDPKGPLYARLQLLPGYVAEQVSKTIIEFVALGKNPRALADELTRAFGMGLSDSLRMARTVQLYAYREASRANYVANSHIVQGWQWYARLDGLTCLSCIAQHGKVYPLEQPLNDHHNGRCVALPVTVLSPDGHIPADAGEQWFKQLSEADQKKMMGPGKYEAWRGQRFTFDRLSREQEDAVYGLMRTETPLKDLIGPLPAK